MPTSRDPGEEGPPGRPPAQGFPRRTAPSFGKDQHKDRNTVERAIGKLKEFRAVATHYDKRGYVHLGTVTAAALVDRMANQFADHGVEGRRDLHRMSAPRRSRSVVPSSRTWSRVSARVRDGGLPREPRIRRWPNCSDRSRPRARPGSRPRDWDEHLLPGEADERVERVRGHAGMIRRDRSVRTRFPGAFIRAGRRAGRSVRGGFFPRRPPGSEALVAERCEETALAAALHGDRHPLRVKPV
ncbi:transposase [Streptomyces sp. CAI-121]|nr:transposase [Streptomyces sp. CAI-121]NUW15465.1 transposase [Streptomyces sp. CAI-68]